MHEQSKGPNDAPSPLPEKEVDMFAMICNDNSQFYMELENREDIISIGETNRNKASSDKNRR